MQNSINGNEEPELANGDIQSPSGSCYLWWNSQGLEREVEGCTGRSYVERREGEEKGRLGGYSHGERRTYISVIVRLDDTSIFTYTCLYWKVVGIRTK